MSKSREVGFDQARDTEGNHGHSEDSVTQACNTHGASSGTTTAHRSVPHIQTLAEQPLSFSGVADADLESRSELRPAPQVYCGSQLSEQDQPQAPPVSDDD